MKIMRIFVGYYKKKNSLKGVLIKTFLELDLRICKLKTKLLLSIYFLGSNILYKL